MITHGLRVWTILAFVGFAFWVSLIWLGASAMIRLFRRAEQKGGRREYVTAVLALVIFVSVLLLSFAVLLVIIGGLSIVLFPS